MMQVGAISSHSLVTIKAMRIEMSSVSRADCELAKEKSIVDPQRKLADPVHDQDELTRTASRIEIILEASFERSLS